MRETATRRAGLNQELIVATAIGLADEGGLDAVTMRGVGQRLGATGMALYRHVANREKLVELMIDRVAGEYAYPDPRPALWRDALEALAWQDWRSFYAHPWMLAATATARPPLGPNLIANMEWALASFDGLRLEPQEQLYLLGVVTSHGHGLGMVWLGGAEVPDVKATTGWWRDRLRESDACPRLNALATALGPEVDVHQEFEFGLARILDGIELHLVRR
ncbi:TetR/AcrR family transcriptional regulator [Crossiella sp. CA198]|uniref:TetR/AcrR family transcriptional regulator n=1 Tax=Crossiella sp. CA198 TaxID=3455607 RepID=UPI003F8D3E61